MVVSPGISPEEALDDNKRFAIVWSILNALRSHDDSFNATINKINLNKEKPSKIVVATVPPMGDSIQSLQDREDTSKVYEERINTQLEFLEQMKTGVYAKMVDKVGDRLYWEKWAKDVGIVAHNLIARIRELIAQKGKHQDDFRDFVTALQDNINSAINDDQAVEMIAQHLITRPVFEALFQNYNFADNNPVCRTMENMIDSLVEIGMEKDTAVLGSFYESVRMNVSDIDNIEGKQEIIKNLYEKFFKGAFPKTVDQLGIVYTSH